MHEQRLSLWSTTFFQFGIRKAHSTEIALIKLVHDIAIAKDRGFTAGAVFSHLAKASDTENDEVLLDRKYCVLFNTTGGGLEKLG